MIRHWIAVTVMVPVETEHPSPLKAEQDAMKIATAALSGTMMRVSAVEWSRQEPVRSDPPKAAR